MRPEWEIGPLTHLLCKRERIREINMQILSLAERRRKLEEEFLRELAVMLDRPAATLLDSHHECPGSPIGNCVFEIVLASKEMTCLFCGGDINR